MPVPLLRRITTLLHHILPAPVLEISSECTARMHVQRAFLPPTAATTTTAAAQSTLYMPPLLIKACSALTPPSPLPANATSCETPAVTLRRLLKDKIIALKKELGGVRKHRDFQRRSRRKLGLPVIALVGYTNAGKSTLLNTLTRAGVMAENMLFATLDPTTRKVKLTGLKV